MQYCSIQLFIAAVFLVSSAVTLTNPCKRNSSVHFMPHPEDTAKFIQCTKRGEMFVFKCKNNQEWDIEAAKCDKPKEKPQVTTGAKPLFLKSKTKTKNLQQTNRKVMTFIDSTTISSSTPTITSTTITSTTTTTSATTSTPSITTTTTTTPFTTATIATTTSATTKFKIPITSTATTKDVKVDFLTTKPSSSLLSMVTKESEQNADYDSMIIQRVRQLPLITPSQREQKLLMDQIIKQQVLNQQGIETQNEITRQQHIDEDIKLRQQVEQQKQLLQQKIIAPQLAHDPQSLHQIQNIIHQQERDEQGRQLKSQRFQQEDINRQHKLNEKQRLEDQLIIQTLFSLDQLDKLNPIFAFKALKN